MSELEPCECGSTDLEETSHSCDKYDDLLMVECNKCFRLIPLDLWNTRPAAVPVEAINALRHQEQIDTDGVMVGVSRQAVDEILEWFDQARGGEK